MSFYVISLTKLEGVPSISYCEIETIDVQMLMNRSNHNTYYNVPEPDRIGLMSGGNIIPQDAHNISQILVLAIWFWHQNFSKERK